MQRIQEILKNATSESKIPTKLEKIQFTIFSAPFSLDTLKISYETSLRKNYITQDKYRITRNVSYWINLNKLKKLEANNQISCIKALPELTRITVIDVRLTS